MHIPDGFLSPPVWATLDVAAGTGVAITSRRAQSELSKIPLLGVMGAFVFGAQMINFPLAAGTSAHLVGGALMTVALGPWAASLVMTAVLILQALIFQDGGILALGANIVNMAILGILAAHLCCKISRGPLAIFFAGLTSVLVSAAAALTELHISDVIIPRPLLTGSAALFVVMGVIEGAITVVALRSISALGVTQQPQQKPLNTFLWAGAAVLIMAGIAFASTAPDVLEGILKTRSAELSWTRKSLAMILLCATFMVGARFLNSRKNA